MIRARFTFVTNSNQCINTPWQVQSMEDWTIAMDAIIVGISENEILKIDTVQNDRPCISVIQLKYISYVYLEPM